MNDMSGPGLGFLNAVVTTELSTLLWDSVRPNVISAWHGHVPFAHWITQAMYPKIIVELGTHNAVSYFAFCNSVAKTRLPTRCYAVDTWHGDKHSGIYDEGVFAEVNLLNQQNFSAFSHLLRSTFDEALSHFSDESIDLLHIDGLHTYNAVKHDFDTWLPKLSEHAVVLFHDIAVIDQDFGVWKFWRELSDKYPSFSFNHSSGLGVLAVGRNVHPVISALCTIRDAELAQDIQKIFSRLGKIAEYPTHLSKAECLISNQAIEIARLKVKLLKSLPQPNAKNIALGRSCLQSSVSEWSCYPTLAEDAQGAVNGKISGEYKFHTGLDDFPWWEVDLGAASIVQEVRLFNRLDLPERATRLRFLTSFDRVSWTEVFRKEDNRLFGGADGDPLIWQPTLPLPSRFFRIMLLEPGYLHLDQVEVFGEQQTDLLTAHKYSVA